VYRADGESGAVAGAPAGGVDEDAKLKTHTEVSRANGSSWAHRMHASTRQRRCRLLADVRYRHWVSACKAVRPVQRHLHPECVVCMRLLMHFGSAQYSGLCVNKRHVSATRRTPHQLYSPSLMSASSTVAFRLRPASSASDCKSFGRENDANCFAFHSKPASSA